MQRLKKLTLNGLLISWPGYNIDHFLRVSILTTNATSNKLDIRAFDLHYETYLFN